MLSPSSPYTPSSSVSSMQQPLTDKEIREALLRSLKRRGKAPEAILEEMHVCNGNAIVDVVAVYKSMHCYEIKGETDSVHRLHRQASFYDQACPIISLVTTPKHLRKVLDILPAHWGVLVATLSPSGSIQLKHARAALRNPNYQPEVALMSLWRSEMLTLPTLTGLPLKKVNRQKIAEYFASKNSVSAINETVGRILAARQPHILKSDNESPYTLYERKSSASELSMA